MFDFFEQKKTSQKEKIHTSKIKRKEKGNRSIHRDKKSKTEKNKNAKTITRKTTHTQTNVKYK